MTMGPQSTTLGALICVLFAVYWAIEPGGVVGYAGAIYGRVSLGKLWGLATLIVMGIGRRWAALWADILPILLVTLLLLSNLLSVLLFFRRL